MTRFLKRAPWAPRLLTAALATWTLSTAGCTPDGPEKPTPEPEVQFGTYEGISLCDDATVKAHPDKRCHTWRAVSGVSMGGGTSARLGFDHADMFDIVGIMGTPFADNDFFWWSIANNYLSGFCELSELEALVAEDPTAINDPSNPRAFCGAYDEAYDDGFPADFQQARPGFLAAIEGGECAMFKSDFNHWYRGVDAGRGGSFTRNSLLYILHDVVAAYGNPFMYNADDAYLPPGLPESWYMPPGSTAPDTRCQNTVSLTGVYNREYNPDGSHPVITFCDGANGRSGAYDPDDASAHRIAVEFLLAVDLNENGKRDYGEPVILNMQERFGDTGSDGIPSTEEAGYDPVTNPDPAGDDWHPTGNPSGTEMNLQLDEGETFDDDGIDGVPGTMDFGEGNGVFDRSPRYERILSRSPTRLFANIDDAQLDRLDIWMDAGIRDFLNTAQASNALFAGLKDRIPDARVYNNYPNLPGVEGRYDWKDVDFSRDGMGQVAYLRYGDASVCPASDFQSGDGNHVGPDIISRFYTLFGFMSGRFPAEDRNTFVGNTLADLNGPTGGLVDFAFLTEFDSPALGRKQEYGVLLPADYYLKGREEQTYPVMYFFHGQGMEAADMVAAGALLLGGFYTSADPEKKFEGKTDFSRMIVIWADGNCQGPDCHTGNFYADFEGKPAANRQFEAGFLDLMRHVDATYRTKKPSLEDR